MKTSFILIFSLLLFNASAQIASCSYDSKDFTRIQASTTMFVLMGDSAFDKAIKEAAKKYWSITKFDFVKRENVNDFINDDTKSFLIPMKFSAPSNHSAGMNSSMNQGKPMNLSHQNMKFWYCLISGGRKSIYFYNDHDPVIIAAFNNRGDESDPVNAAYRIDYMIKGMNDIFLQVKEKQITGGGLKIGGRCMDAINEGTVKQLSSKTIVINKDEQLGKIEKLISPIVSESLFADSKYPYKFKYVSDSTFKSILKGNDPEFLCLIPVFEVNKHILVYEPSTRKTVYYGLDMMGSKVKEKDIENMAEGKN